MVEVVRATLGEHVPLRLKARERRSDSLNGRLFDLNGIRIQAITKPDGASVAAASIPAFAHVARGEYAAFWDTSGESQAGPYTVKVEATIGYDTVAASRITVPKYFIVLLNKVGGIP